MPKRVQRKRTKGYRLPANTVSVTRPGIFGNPFTGPEAVALFRAFLEGGTIVAQGDPESLQAMEETRATILRRFPELRGNSKAFLFRSRRFRCAGCVTCSTRSGSGPIGTLSRRSPDARRNGRSSITNTGPSTTSPSCGGADSGRYSPRKQRRSSLSEIQASDFQDVQQAVTLHIARACGIPPTMLTTTTAAATGRPCGDRGPHRKAENDRHRKLRSKRKAQRQARKRGRR